MNKAFQRVSQQALFKHSHDYSANDSIKDFDWVFMGIAQWKSYQNKMYNTMSKQSLWLTYL